MKGLKVILVLIVTLIILSSVGNGALASHSGTRTPVTHVINILFENHTFDNFFGIYPDDPTQLILLLLLIYQNP